jgi:tetratricopeptide (TPR) repeat protein
LEKYNEKTKWVVKSSSQILGPYGTDEVFELIKKKSIIPIDEIIPENGFWAYVRDVSLFQSALSMQAKTAGVEVTKTQNITHTFTDDMTSTELMEDTEELSHVGEVDRTNPNPKIQPIRSSNLPKPGMGDFLSAKNKADQNAKKTQNISVFKLLVLVILTLGFVGYHFQDWIKNQTVKFNSTTVIQESQDSLASGDYKLAYSQFQEINQIEAIKTEIKGFYIQFASLVLNQERQTVYARDLLEKSKEDLKNTPEWLTSMGLSYLIDQNFVEAQKYLSQSINLNPDFLPAWINLGHMYLSQNKFQEAWDFFYSAYLRGYSEGHVTAFMSIALIEQWKVNGNIDLLVKAHDLLSNFLSTSADRRYLNLILKMWLDTKINPKNKSGINIDIAAFIESDPYVASKFKQNVYEFGFENKRFESYCSDISRNLQNAELNSLLFNSICYFQLGFIGRATESSLEKAEELYPKDALMFAVKSVILANPDENYQKSLLIGRALSSDSKSNHILPLILQARFCEQKNDLVCSAKYWNMVFERNKLEIGAYVGLAKFFKSKKENQKAKNWISNGLLLSPSYKPLIELND